MQYSPDCPSGMPDTPPHASQSDRLSSVSEIGELSGVKPAHRLQ